MMSARPKILLAALMAVGAMACAGAPGGVQDSPEAVPGMEGETQPSLGTGVSEQPDK